MTYVHTACCRPSSTIEGERCRTLTSARRYSRSQGHQVADPANKQLPSLPLTYIFIHIRPRGSHDTADIKDSRPTARPLLLSRQRGHFGSPSGSVRRCHYQLVQTIYFTVTEQAALWIVGASLHKSDEGASHYPVRWQAQHVAEVAHTSLPHSQHQVVHRRGGRGTVVLLSYHMETTAIKAIDHKCHHLVRAQAVQQWVRRAHGEFVQPQLRLPRKTVVSP